MENCPKCGSDDVEIDNGPEFNGSGVQVTMECCDCHTKWIEDYRITLNEIQVLDELDEVY